MCHTLSGVYFTCTDAVLIFLSGLAAVGEGYVGMFGWCPGLPGKKMLHEICLEG